MPERVTAQLLAVLEAFLADPAREWYGLELMEKTGLKSGTVYPILRRLVTDGWLTRTREILTGAGGTPRRLYRLTGLGENAATSLLMSRVRQPRRDTPRFRPRIQPA